MERLSGNPSLIFDIKRYSINDGPGIRVTVFFKGCSLSCAWCHNPESQSFKVQKLYSINKCIACHSCVLACPNQALATAEVIGILTHAELCEACGKCAEACPTKAMEICGREWDVEDVMNVIRKDMQIMETSGGGVTFSGGEPLQHPEMLIELLKACGNEGIHRAVDTSGLVKKAVLRNVASHTDLILYDLKLMDPVRHLNFTGVSNELILENLRDVAAYHKAIIIRIPVIEGVNADPENMKETAAFIASLAGEPKLVNLLPYHSIASAKYARLGENYKEGEMKEPGKALMMSTREIFESFGLEAKIGG